MRHQAQRGTVALCAAMLLLSAAAVHGATSTAYTVSVDTTLVANHPAGPFSVFVVLTDGAGVGNASTKVRITELDLGGGNGVEDVWTLGGVGGSLATGVTLTDPVPPPQMPLELSPPVETDELVMVALPRRE